VIDRLLDGDPAIRWQVLRSLLPAWGADPRSPDGKGGRGSVVQSAARRAPARVPACERVQLRPGRIA